MTQFPHDDFIKDYLPELFKEYGTAITSQKVAPEVKEIDVFFIPNQLVPTTDGTIGLLGRLAVTSCLFEVYRNPITIAQVGSCLTKLLEMNSKIRRETPQTQWENLAFLWILTPTLSEKILELFGAIEQVDQWSCGIYIAPQGYRMGFVVIHQLPVTEETLWLRLLGKGRVQELAISELKNLPANHPKKDNILELVYGLFTVLEINRKQGQPLDSEDEQLIMKISAIYLSRLEEATNKGLEQGIEIGLEQGRKQGEASLTIRQLKRLLGELPIEVETVIAHLPVSTLEFLAEDLLDFQKKEDLTDWLSTHQ